MAFLKIHTVKIEDEFVSRGKIDVSDRDIQKLNSKINESIRKNNDEQIRIIDKMNLLNKPFK